jgi:hypothetical protein
MGSNPTFNLEKYLQMQGMPVSAWGLNGKEGTTRVSAAPPPRGLLTPIEN